MKTPSDFQYYHPCDISNPVTMPRVRRTDIAIIMLTKLGLFVAIIILLLGVTALGLRYVFVHRQRVVPLTQEHVEQAKGKLSDIEVKVKNANLAIAHANYSLKNTSILNSIFAVPMPDGAPFQLQRAQIKAFAYVPSEPAKAAGDSRQVKREPLLAYHVEIAWGVQNPAQQSEVAQVTETLLRGMRPDFALNSPVSPWVLGLQGTQTQSSYQGGGLTQLTYTGDFISSDSVYAVRKAFRPSDARIALQNFYRARQ